MTWFLYQVMVRCRYLNDTVLVSSLFMRASAAENLSSGFQTKCSATEISYKIDT